MRTMHKAIETFCERLRHTLLHGGSINDEDRKLWTKENFHNLHEALELNPRGEEGSFMPKILQQIEGASKTILDRGNPIRDISKQQQADLIPLMLELASLYYVFPSHTTVSKHKKRSQLEYLLKGGQDIVKKLDLPPENRELLLENFKISRDAIEAGGIGSGGGGYNTNKWREIYYLKKVFKCWYEMPEDVRKSLLNPSKGSFKFQDFLDDVAGVRSPQCRHVLLHLLFPDYYEPITSAEQKRKITRIFSDLYTGKYEYLISKEWNGEEPKDLTDQKIKVIKERLGGENIDFYDPKIAIFLGSASSEAILDLDVELLEYKKQVVLYGPPGTSKTYSAQQLAQEVIMYRMAQDMGTSILLGEGQKMLQKAVNENIHRLQLHPAYSYEDFIQGLQFEELGKMSYQKGYLLRLLDDMKENPDVPHVLILDEINRVDLSRLFGECFSALENRGQPIDLLGSNKKGKTTQIEIPDNLYVIGTMNLIDHSVEQLDFALRRRFLWVKASYNAGALLDICREKWGDEKDEANKSPDWDEVAPNFEQLVNAADNLNAAIRSEDELGEDFVLGHTFFTDAVPFSHQFLHSRSKAPKRFLFKESGDWLEPIEKLWRLSLSPLLKEYVSGLDNKSQKKIMDNLKKAFRP